MLVFDEGEYIDVVQQGGNNRRFGSVIFDDFVFLFDRLRLLKTQLCGQSLHLFIKMLADLRNIPF